VPKDEQGTVTLLGNNSLYLMEHQWIEKEVP
jgi:hypothetical protein